MPSRKRKAPRRSTHTARRGASPSREHAERSRGAQPGNHNALTHGAYAAPAIQITGIDDVIADVQTKQSRLSALLDELVLTGDTDNLETITKLFALHAQNASRLGRLLRDQRALSGASADGIAGAIAAALDELSTELGVAL